MITNEKAYFQFNKGINTEASLLAFPEGFSSDEVNFDLDVNGSRRRRRGLAQEAGGSNYTLPAGSYSAGDVVRSFKWENVAGDSSLNFRVIQIGYLLHIYKDLSAVTGSAVISSNKSVATIDLRTYAVDGTSGATLGVNTIDLAFGRGHAFVVGKYIEPFWVKYTPSTDKFTVTSIAIRERDFEGIDDGYSNLAQPTAAITSHTYNLYNRGWRAADITAYQTAKSRQPSKAMIPYLGLRRATTAGVAENDWTKAFSADKLDGELFQDASAPTGHFIRNPFNTSSVELPGASTQFAITTWTISGTTPGTQTITITTAGNHGLSVGNSVSISGNIGYYESSSGVLGSFPDFYVPFFSFDGTQVAVTVPTTTTFTIAVEFPPDFIAWSDQYASRGNASTSLVPNASGYVSPTRPKAVAFFSGRVWYAGTNQERLANKVFFSQVIESDAQYGKCYQIADPTDERISDLVPSDGGVIVIPEMADVLDIQDWSSFLIIYATNGIWQIGPGAGGFFGANSYSVRKITDQGAVSASAIVEAEGVPMYWGFSDIWALMQDPNSGYLVAQNMSSTKINRLVNGIPHSFKQTVQGCYDDLNKRIIWVYGNVDGDVSPTTYQYNYGLTFDIRLQAFIKYKFVMDANGYLSGIFATKGSISGNGPNKVKFLSILTGPVFQISEASNSTTYKDWDIAEPEAYIVTGYEVLGDPSRGKTGHWAHVFLYKTETGYTELGDQYIPVGESSVKLQARWNWADLSVSGKWGPEWETYRHQRLYSPLSPYFDGFDDGQPLIFTKNRIRGSGRSLHLKFSAGPGKDAWIAGWKIDTEMKRTA